MTDEPRYTSTRTDADSYADYALTTMQQHGTRFLERQQGHVRNALVEAFNAGELQGEFRALWILTIALNRAHDPEARALIRQCIALLAPDIEGWEIENESE